MTFITQQSQPKIDTSRPVYSLFSNGLAMPVNDENKKALISSLGATHDSATDGVQVIGHLLFGMSTQEDYVHSSHDLMRVGSGLMMLGDIIQASNEKILNLELIKPS